MADSTCLHENMLITIVNIDPETDHRETMCHRCYKILCDEFIPTDRVSTGQSNYTMMTYV